MVLGTSIFNPPNKELLKSQTSLDPATKNQVICMSVGGCSYAAKLEELLFYCSLAKIGV